MSFTETRIRGRFLEIILSRPEKNNLFSVSMYSKIADALEGANHNAHVHVAVLRPKGADFTIGTHLGELLRDRESTLAASARFIEAAARFEKILVTGIRGRTIGIGASLLLHSDFVLAASDATLQFPFVHFGLTPGAGSGLLLPRRAGYLRAAEAMLLGDPFVAHEARELGLVTRVVEPAAFDPELDALADRLASQPPETLLATKRLLRAQPATLDAQLALERAALEERLQSPEFTSILSALRGGSTSMSS